MTYRTETQVTATATHVDNPGDRVKFRASQHKAAANDLARRMVAAHGVDRDQHPLQLYEADH